MSRNTYVLICCIVWLVMGIIYALGIYFAMRHFGAPAWATFAAIFLFSFIFAAWIEVKLLAIKLGAGEKR